MNYVRARNARGHGVLPLTSPDHDYYAYSKLHKPRRATFWPRALRLAACVLVAAAVLFGWWLSTPILKAVRTTRTPDHPSELVFLSETGALTPFPSLYDEPTRVLSVVVPAYNEELRMPVGVPEMITWLKSREAQVWCAPSATRSASPQCGPFTWEIIIVNDGSKDGTVAVAEAFVQAEGSEHVRLLNLHANSGKGAAVRKGVMRARGRYVLMADADGATRFSDVARLMKEMDTLTTSLDVPSAERGSGFAIGSRAHMGDAPAAVAPAAAAVAGGAPAAPPATVRRSALRGLLMWGFHQYMNFMIGGAGSIKDTQCGFKLFTRSAARRLFSVLHIERWAFDVELVYLAARVGVPMVVSVRACAHLRFLYSSAAVIHRILIPSFTTAMLPIPLLRFTPVAAGGACHVARGGREQGQFDRG